MATHAVQSIEKIDIDANVFVLLGFFGVDLANLGPKAAAKKLRNRIFISYNDRLMSVARRMVDFRVKTGHIDPQMSDAICTDLFNQLIAIRDELTRREHRLGIE
ncbi:MAG TPA: hypothetical protein VIJ29_02500 [Candidatus Paceibacterota bacterium]